MSKLSDAVYNTLREIYPHQTIDGEYYVYYKGTRLFFDFYLRGMRIFIECQGAQHSKFVKHFHGTAENFRAAKKRDRLKLEYIEEHDDSALIYFYDWENITKGLVLQRLYDSQEELEDE